MSGVLKGLLVLLEERLVEHDESRKEVQTNLKETCSKIMKDADSLRERISKLIGEDFNAREEEILGLIEKINEGEGDMDDLVKKAKEKLSKEWKYEIQHFRWARSFVDSYKLKVSSVKVEKELNFDSTESIVNALQEHLEKIHKSMNTTQEKLDEICNERRKEGEELEKRVNGRLEEVFKAEDTRIKSVVKVANKRIDSVSPEEVKELTRKAKLALLKNQKYSLFKQDSLDTYDLKVEREASLKFIDFEERKPTNIVPSFTEKGNLSLSFAFFDEDEVEVLKGVDLISKVEVKIWEKGHKESTSGTFTKEFTLGSDEPVCFRGPFTANTAYSLRMRIVHQEMSTQWSDEAEFTTPEFKDLCVWKECPDNVDGSNKYSVDEKNHRIATKINEYGWSTIIGNTPLPLNKVPSWSIKILKSRESDGYDICIGVAPSGIDQNEENSEKCGWYIHCWDSTLHSGPPHNYEWPGKEYGPRREKGEYVHTGDIIGVVMDTTKGDLSFVLNGVNLGVAYEGIPLNEPLVPCLILKNEDDSVELVI